jgi:hypothetical protein
VAATGVAIDKHREEKRIVVVVGVMVVEVHLLPVQVRQVILLDAKLRGALLLLELCGLLLHDALLLIELLAILRQALLLLRDELLLTLL